MPELISILGVEVPDPPDVSLTAIGVDKATVAWTRPQANRPVQKFLIQVNGVNGEYCVPMPFCLTSNTIDSPDYSDQWASLPRIKIPLSRSRD